MATITRKKTKRDDAASRLRILCVHGVGHQEADPRFEATWREAITSGLAPWMPAGSLDTEFVAYDDLFAAVTDPVTQQDRVVGGERADAGDDPGRNQDGLAPGAALRTDDAVCRIANERPDRCTRPRIVNVRRRGLEISGSR